MAKLNELYNQYGSSSHVPGLSNVFLLRYKIHAEHESRITPANKAEITITYILCEPLLILGGSGSLFGFISLAAVQIKENT